MKWYAGLTHLVGICSNDGFVNLLYVLNNECSKMVYGLRHEQRLDEEGVARCYELFLIPSWDFPSGFVFEMLELHP
jgi:hypothetical protein